MLCWQVLWENKEGLSDGVPNIIYISREKRPQHPHHYKAGAMNVLVKFIGSNQISLYHKLLLSYDLKLPIICNWNRQEFQG